MGFEKLLMLINEKLLLVEEAKDKRELKIEEITRLKDVIASLKDNPFKLYELDTNDFVYVSKSLSLSDEYLNQLSKFKTIYEGFLKFGRDAIPQISLAENFVDATKKLLEKRTALLADKVAEYQYAESMERQYAKLKDEVISEDKEIASVDLLLELVNSSSRLSDEEKNNIKMEAIKKNNALYEKMLLSTDEAQMSRKINEINERLNDTFKPKTLLKIKEVYKILSQCSNDEEIASILNQWSYSFGDDFNPKVVDALIAFANIDLLETKSLIDDDVENHRDDLEPIENRIQLLKEYKESTDELEELEEEATEVLVNKAGKLEQALSEYDNDPLGTKNCVLFLSERIENDIRDIDSQETIEDTFLLIEQLRNDNVGKRVVFTSNKKLKGLEELKPNSKGRQARVVYTRLRDNIFGIIGLFGKKADSSRSITTTLDSRKKNCNIDELQTTISKEDVFEHYLELTRDISMKLKDRVVSNVSEKENQIAGGAK